MLKTVNNTQQNLEGRGVQGPVRPIGPSRPVSLQPATHRVSSGLGLGSCLKTRPGEYLGPGQNQVQPVRTRPTNLLQNMIMYIFINSHVLSELIHIFISSLI